MIEMARKRNQFHADKVRFVTSSIEEADLGDEVYDKAFAVHVAALEKPGDALDVVRHRLATDGRLYPFSQAPGWKAPDQPRRFGAELSRVLENEGFEVEDVVVKDFGTAFPAGDWPGPRTEPGEPRPSAARREPHCPALESRRCWQPSVSSFRSVWLERSARSC
jgi:hypothetical protein